MASSVPPARQYPWTWAMIGVAMSIISNQPCSTWRAQAPSAGLIGQGGSSERSWARS